MAIKRFEDLEVWQSARVLARDIYALTRKREFEKDWALRDQIRRATISVMANIAEGFERGSNKQFLLFLSYSLASAAELKSHLYLTLDVHYITADEFSRLIEQLDSVAKQIKGFRKYLKSVQR